MISLFAVLGLLGLFLLPLLLKSQGPRRRAPIHALWLRFLRRLEKAGVKSRPSMGAQSVALEAAGALPGNAAEIENIAGLYNRYRYSPSPPVFNDLKRAINSFRPGKRNDDGGEDRKT